MAVRPEQLAQTLLHRARKELSTWQLRAEAVRRELPALLAEVAPGHRAWLIGSLTTSDWGEGSDVDIVVEGLSMIRRFEAQAALASALKTPVDLLVLESLEQTFRDRVLDSGIRLDVP